MNDSDIEKRRKILRRLCEMKSIEGILSFAIIASRDHDRNPDDWDAFEESLKKNGPVGIPYLIDQLAAKDVIRRRCAAYALGQIPMYGKPALNALIKSCQDKDSLVRDLSMEAMEAIKKSNN